MEVDDEVRDVLDVIESGDGNRVETSSIAQDPQGAGATQACGDKGELDHRVQRKPRKWGAAAVESVLYRVAGCDAWWKVSYPLFSLFLPNPLPTRPAPSLLLPAHLRSLTRLPAFPSLISESRRKTQPHAPPAPLTKPRFTAPSLRKRRHFRAPSTAASAAQAATIIRRR